MWPKGPIFVERLKGGQVRRRVEVDAEILKKKWGKVAGKSPVGVW